jgi:uncharacterized membrane protein
VKTIRKIILIAYWSPYFIVLLFSDFDSAAKRFRPGVFDRAYSIYFIAGIFVLPFLLYGLPSIASIKNEIQADRTRNALKRKLQLIGATISVTVMFGLTVAVIPPRSAISATFDILVFLLLFGAMVWLRFRERSDEEGPSPEKSDSR